MKIIKSFDESGFLIKDVNEAIKNEAKEQERRFLRMLSECYYYYWVLIY